MERSCGITLITLFLTIAKVYGQACPEGSNVVQMCVPGSYSGDSVLIDTGSYNPSISNCSCTFGTTSSIIKLVTYVAPNYPECNSAVRLYSSSGNSIRFQCLMSGTYLDTSVHNAGVATFEKYGDMYDKNYCLMLEIAGRIGDIVTVTCTGDEATKNNIATNVAKESLDTSNDTMNTANNTNDSITDHSTGTNTSLPLTELSTIDTPVATTGTIVEASNMETTSNTTSINKTENQVDLTDMDVSTKGIMAHTRRENFRETSKTDILTTAIPLEVTTLNSSDGQTFELNVTDNSQLKQDMAFINSGLDNLNATSNVSDIVINTTNGTLEPLEGAGTYRREETKPIDTVTAIVTGTVLFNGGGTNSSKTIQTIGAVLSDSLLVQSHETPMETTTSKIEYYVSSSSLNTKPSQETSEFLLSDMPGITQPTDVSNLLVMEESNSPNSKSEITGAKSNLTDTRSSDYSIQFPSFESLSSLPVRNNTSNMTDANFSDIITANTGINDSLSMKTDFETRIFMNSSETNTTDAIAENNTLFKEPLEANRLSIKMASPVSQMISTQDVISHNNITVGAENKSHFTTKEVRFVMENTAPTDVVGNITIRSIMPTENTTGGNITIRSILPTENTTEKTARNFSVSSMEGSHGASSTGSISKGGMEISSFVTESPEFTKTTLGTELKAMEMSSFVTESPEYSTLGTELKGTESFSTNLVKDNTLTVLEQTTPVHVSYENFTDAQSMFESTGKSDLSNTTTVSESTEKIIVNPTVGKEVSSNYTQSMFESTGKSDILNTTKFSKSTKGLVVNPTVGNEEIIFNPTVVKEVSSSHIPTTPSSLDLVYKESSVSTASSNTAVHSKATSPVPTTIVLDTSKAALFDEHNSFGTPSYLVPEQNSTDPTASASMNESLNLTETVVEVVPGHDTLIDDGSRINNKNVSFSDASLSEVLSPSMNETNINFLSSIQRINSPNLNLNESIIQAKTQSLYDSAIMPKDNATVSELNNTQVIPDTTINLPYVKQESANLSQAITSEATSTNVEQNINHLTFLHTDRVDLSDVNISENSTEIKDHLSFFYNESVPLSSANETEVTQEITTINKDNLSFVQRTTVPFTNINTNVGMQETTRQSIDRMSFVQRERLPSEDMKSTGGWQDITTPYTDQMAFVHRDRVPLTDKESTGGWQETSTKRTDQMPFVQREILPPVDIKPTGGWQDITPLFTDKMAFVHRDNVPLTDIKSTEGMQETATQNIAQMSFVQSESLPSADIKSTVGLQEITTSYMDPTAFVHRDSVPLTDIKPTVGWQEITTKNIDQMSFVQRDTVPSANIEATRSWQEITTQGIDQMADVYREPVPFAGNKASEISPEITTQNINQVSFFHQEDVKLADINTTEITPETVIKNSDNTSDFIPESVHVSDPNVVEIPFDITTEGVKRTSFSLRGSTSIPDSKVSQSINETGFGTSLTEQPNLTTKATNGYVFDSGIDQHNLLAFNETHPIDTYHATTDKVALQDMFSQTTKDMPASTMSSELDTFADQVSSKDFMHSTTGLSPTSTASLTVPVLNESTSNIPEISTAAPTKIIPTITEEVKVHEKINKEEVVAQEKSLQEMTTSKTFISVSTESYIHSDILAGIENQIITETESKQTPIWIKSTIRSNRVELSKPVATDVMVKDIEHSVKNTDTKSPDFSTTATTVESNTVVRNEDLHPENIHPEPISPRVPSHIDNHMNIPTTPAQSFHTIEETVKVSAEINPINDGAKTDPVSENGMNVYFDTGSSKNSPFEMNNDTYIIVVGAIVGLVVLAVVIGILCHNSRKTRSEKVNISGEVDPTSHQNQVFDSEAADAEQGASSNGVVRDSSIPVENGGSNDTSEKEHNGNVES